VHRSRDVGEARMVRTLTDQSSSSRAVTSSYIPIA
jgi:hypothetical protein